MQLPAGFKPIADLASKIVYGGLAFLTAFDVAVAIRFCVSLAEHARLAPPWLATSADVFKALIWVGDLIVVGA